MKLIFSLSEMSGQDGHIDDRGEACCENSTQYTHLQGEYENKVKKDIGQAAGGGCQHGQFRIAIVTHKGIQYVTQDECR